MTRQEYYEEVEKVMKHSSKLPMCMEIDGPYGWMPISFYEEKIPVNAKYRLHFNIGSVNFIIEEAKFDKYYMPMMTYSGKNAVVYRDADVGITVNNLRYAIMNEFQDYFLQPY